MLAFGVLLLAAPQLLTDPMASIGLVALAVGAALGISALQERRGKPRS
jgi:uncharacterized membrane protein HdeD (DUF308 family)